MGKSNPKSESKQGVVALDSFPGQGGQSAALNSSEPAAAGIEAKQAVITSADVKSGKLFRVAGLRGGFGRTHFGDDSVTTRPVDEETEAQLRSTFGEAVEEVK